MQESVDLERIRKAHDKWERLVEDVLRKERDRRLALLNSTTSGSSSSSTFDPDWSSTQERTSLWIHTSPLSAVPESDVPDNISDLTVSPLQRLQSMFIPANKLETTRGNTPEKWAWRSVYKYNSSSRKKEDQVGELLGVHWLEIKAKIDVQQLFPNTNYAVFLVFKIKDSSSKNLEKATAAIRFKNEIVDYRDDEGYIVYLNKERSGPDEKGRFPKRRDDGWMEIKLGEFYNSLRYNRDDHRLSIRLRENDTEKQKRGLLLRGMDIRPYM